MVSLFVLSSQAPLISHLRFLKGERSEETFYEPHDLSLRFSLFSSSCIAPDLFPRCDK